MMQDLQILKQLAKLLSQQQFTTSCDKQLLSGLHTIINEKWITVHPHGKDGDDYRRIKVEDNETVKQAIERTFKDEKSKGASKSIEGKVFETREAVDAYWNKGSNANYKRWLESLTDDEKYAIAAYTEQGYESLNDYLRHPKDYNELRAEELDEFTETLDNLIDKFELSEPITVYRAIDSKFVSHIQKSYTDKAFQSSTITFDGFFPNIIEPANDAGKAILELSIPKGKGYGAYIKDWSSYNDEYEFLIKRNAKFRVKEKTKKGGRWHIKLDLI